MSSVAAPAPVVQKFPTTFYYANAIELFERMAFFGMYIGLSLYLSNVIKFDDRESGALLGNFRLVGSLSPIVCGAIADRITFKRSLIVAFTMYAAGYAALLALPTQTSAKIALFTVAIAGGFMKPVITGTVARTAPPGREAEGFGIFYRMINAGSVVGKSAAYLVRRVAPAMVMMNAVVASLVALALAIFGYTEPQKGAAKKTDLGETLRGYGTALRNLRFVGFLVVFAGFYFMAEQFYMTFPKYVTRHIDEKAPLEIITLINPLVIAVFQGAVTKACRQYRSLTVMCAGVFIASFSMLVMGVVPGIVGACLSGAIFAVAEMVFSHRYYESIASFAPEGKAGMYMGLAFVPFAIGAWVGGQVSGPMIQGYLPAKGFHDPFAVWGTYALMGLGCGALALGYRWLATEKTSEAVSQ